MCFTGARGIIAAEWDGGYEMIKLASMMNLGEEMERKLLSVGIGSAEELMAVGAKEAFSRLKARYPQVCLVHLYALEGLWSR